MTTIWASASGGTLRRLIWTSILDLGGYDINTELFEPSSHLLEQNDVLRGTVWYLRTLGASHQMQALEM
ncbi:hypothetical protein B0H19DRAFT_1268700 [Mycena capillaripes]|nr:hypothetical protein B0H19DRAFT_1268700 [Mycena capillaripes]